MARMYKPNILLWLEDESLIVETMVFSINSDGRIPDLLGGRLEVLDSAINYREL